jgi:UPF0176 protein
MSAQSVQIAALYQFCTIGSPGEMAASLRDFCRARSIKGTLLVAHEGINGTVAGSPEAIRELLDHLRAVLTGANMEVKHAWASIMPFHRLKVRLKKEIVTMGVEGIDPARSTGAYLAPEDWNDFVGQPDAVVIDARNDYEFSLGTFEGALNPRTRSFREFPSWLRENREYLSDKRVAMFCTGGIRCEKATAYARSLGIENVFQLKGGILKYLETIPPERSLFRGECFVFDERVSVTHGLQRGEARLCRACRRPLTVEDRRSSLYVEGVSCPHCHAERSEADRARYAERHRQVSLAEARGGRHIGS